MKPRTWLPALLLVAAALVTSRARCGDEYITLESGSSIDAPAYPAGELQGMIAARDRSRPGGPPAVTLRRRAENVALAVTLANDGRQAEQRNRELLETLQRLVERAEASPGIRIHNGQIGLSTRDRKLVSFGSYDARTSINLYVLAVLPADKSALEVTNSIKEFLTGVQAVGQTRITEGSVGLSIRDPEQYRRDLLARIVEDVHFITGKLGGSATVSISGLDRPITVRQRSDTEVELVIPYSYAIEFQTK